MARNSRKEYEQERIEWAGSARDRLWTFIEKIDIWIGHPNQIAAQIATRFKMDKSDVSRALVQLDAESLINLIWNTRETRKMGFSRVGYKLDSADYERLALNDPTAPDSPPRKRPRARRR